MDLGSVVSRASLLEVVSDRPVLKESGICLVPQDRQDGESLRLETILGGIEDRLKAQGKAFSPDKVLVTLSARGEPRAVCAGVVRGISGESAKRAALCAGATVTDVLAVDDGRHDSERVSDLRRQDVTMALFAGGVDENILGSGRHQLFSMARILAQGLPRRRGGSRKIPLVYAASLEGREEVQRILGEETDIFWADNVRATLEEERLDSARQAMVDIFADHVRHAPEFGELGKLGSPAVLPSGHALGCALEAMYENCGQNLLGFSLDGDVVQVFSNIDGVFTRTVTGIDKVDPRKAVRWLPGSSLVPHASDAVSNFKLRPWMVPSSWDELALFLALWKEAIREAVEEHKKSAVELRGIPRKREISEAFQVKVSGGDTLIKAQRIRAVVLSGYVSDMLSDSALFSVALDGVPLSGFTRYYRDARNLLTFAGSVSGQEFVDLETCMRPLAFVASPGPHEQKVRSKWAILRKGTETETLPVKPGEIVQASLDDFGEASIVLQPSRGEDLGEGEGRHVETRVEPGFPGLYLDCRPRPAVSAAEKAGMGAVQKWYRNLGVFPERILSDWSRGEDR